MDVNVWPELFHHHKPTNCDWTTFCTSTVIEKDIYAVLFAQIFEYVVLHRMKFVAVGKVVNKNTSHKGITIWLFNMAMENHHF